LIIVIIGLLFYINLSKDTSKEITAIVKQYDDGYIVVKDQENEDQYILSVSDKYETGDIIDLTIDDIDDDKNPKTATIKDIQLLSRSISFSLTDDNNANENGNDANENNNNDDNEGNVKGTTNDQNVQKYTEEDIVSYFTDLDNEASNTKSITSSLKNGFVTIVDFLFYGAEIKGQTFNDLTTATKLKVLKLALSIDSKLNDKFPNYKNTLSEKYQNIKSKVVSKYLDITVDACSKNQDTCSSAKEGLADLKNSFSITWSFIKDISGVGVSKLQSWYSVWKNV
jgi:hypothetical protein